MREARQWQATGLLRNRGGRACVHIYRRYALRARKSVPGPTPPPHLVASSASLQQPSKRGGGVSPFHARRRTNISNWLLPAYPLETLWESTRIPGVDSQRNSGATLAALSYQMQVKCGGGHAYAVPAGRPLRSPAPRALFLLARPLTQGSSLTQPPEAQGEGGA